MSRLRGARAPRRPWSALLAAALTVVLGLSAGAPVASAASPCADVDTEPSTIGVERSAAALGCLVNRERDLAGLGTVVVDPKVRIAAQRYAEDMATRGFFAHESPEGTDPGQRLTIAGFGWSAFGENIAAGQRTAREVMTAWLDSKGHCENLMTPMFTVAGFGIAAGFDGPYWVQEFARPMASGTTVSALQAPACPRLPAADDAVRATTATTPVAAPVPATPATMAAPWAKRSGRRLRVRLALPAGDGTLAVAVRVRQAGRTVRTTTMRRPAGSTQRLTVRLRSARGGRVVVSAGAAAPVGVSFR
ncbi:CAP domain-containing protein [Patulibacter sp.]|uniref:CAP domain-containing protein n=1 Tax=Patulibacter sp. TaxID=1912859 RepID=UPI002722EB90|nr:CAP domain-containing protein [Patulibacter sp.]MDO9408351.1 CAP domain-containing protein [Patulibacter sp.]